MARHKQVPPVARPTGRRRLVELGKDLLIVLLICSAVLLAVQTPLADQFRGWMTEPIQDAEPVARQRSEAVAPYALTVRNSTGLYGVSYDQALVERAFERLSPLLGEALATAGTAESASRHQWQALLESPGIYCSFQGSPPLAALSAWLGGRENLRGRAEALVMAWDGSTVWLCWRDGNTYRRAATQVAYGGHLDVALAEFNPNGAAFAYALAEEDDTYDALDPYVLISMTAPQPQVWSATSPDFVSDRASLEQLLSNLGFQAGVDFAYESGGDLAINENGDRLRVGAGGQVRFHAGGEPRYAVAAAEDKPTVAEAALTAWDLLNRAAGPWKGEGSYVLAGAEETTDGWIITFRARVGGIPVWLGEEGWTARFTVKDRQISDFTLALRTYADTGATSVVPRERLAAAALSALPNSGGQLILRYNDTGAVSLSAGWVAES